MGRVVRKLQMEKFFFHWYLYLTPKWFAVVDGNPFKIDSTCIDPALSSHESHVVVHNISAFVFWKFDYPKPHWNHTDHRTIKTTLFGAHFGIHMFYLGDFQRRRGQVASFSSSFRTWDFRNGGLVAIVFKGKFLCKPPKMGIAQCQIKLVFQHSIGSESHIMRWMTCLPLQISPAKKCSKRTKWLTRPLGSE